MNTHILLGITASAILLSPLRADESSLENDFKKPPTTAQPYVWWHWLGPNFSKEGITKDLVAMKASGVGGATIYGERGYIYQESTPMELSVDQLFIKGKRHRIARYPNLDTAGKTDALPNGTPV